MPTKMFGSNIKTRREQLGLLQKDLAEALVVTKTAIGKKSVENCITFQLAM